MPDPITLGGISAVGSVINSSVSVTQKLFELKGVGEQTRDLLETSEQINTTLGYARTLRRRKSTILSTFEKRWIDGVLDTTENAVNSVAVLTESARVDMCTKGKISLATRGLFVVRDSPNVSASLARLGIASQSLNTAMGILCGREGAPPTYEESQGLGLKSRRTGLSKKPKEEVDDAGPFVTAHQAPPNYPHDESSFSSPISPPNWESKYYSEFARYPAQPAQNTAPYPVSDPFPQALQPQSFQHDQSFTVPSGIAELPESPQQARRAPQMDLADAMSGLHVCSDWTEDHRSSQARRKISYHGEEDSYSHVPGPAQGVVSGSTVSSSSRGLSRSSRRSWLVQRSQG